MKFLLLILFFIPHLIGNCQKKQILVELIKTDSSINFVDTLNLYLFVCKNPECNIENNVINGTLKKYYLHSNKLFYEINFKDGFYHGKVIGYFVSGDTLEYSNFFYDTLNGQSKYYYEGNKLATIHEYSNGEFDGYSVYLKKNGDTTYVKKYSHGLLDGETILFKRNKRKVILTYKQGGLIDRKRLKCTKYK